MQMDTKQKALLVITVAAFGYLGYQIYGLMKSDMSSAPPVAQLPRHHASHTHLVSNNVGPVAVANAAEPRSPLTELNKSPAPAQIQRAPLVTGQKAYLHMVNQYELAKMKRRLLEERAAIAAAQHRIASLNQQTHQIDATLAGSPEVYDDTGSEPRTAPYKLSYVDRQNGDWSATLNRNGRYYQVHNGTKLADGSEVVDINRGGVILKNADKRERVTFDGIVQLPKEKPHPVAKVKEAVYTPPKTMDVAEQARRALTAAGLLSAKPMKASLDDKDSVVKAQETILTTAMKKTPEKKEHDIVVAEKKPIVKKAVPVKVAIKKPEVTKPVVKKVAVEKADTMKAMPAKTKPVKAAVKMPLPEIKKVTVAKKPVIKTPELKKAATVKKPVQPKAVLAMNDVAPANTSTRYTEDEDRILAMPKKSYTIQLIGSYHRDIVENFAIANDLGNRAMQFYVLNRGKRWYVLLYGSYPTRAAAQKALKELPPDLTPEDPWIRSIASVQGDIRSHKHPHLKA